MKSIKLYQQNIHKNSDNVTMDCYLAENAEGKTPAIVIFPGGGYYFCSPREAEPIAKAYNSYGYSAFVVWYTIKPNCEVINPLLDAATAVYTVRKNADEYGIDGNKIAVCGFSAGGHLAAHISTCWNSPIIKEKLGINENDAKPNASILCYPVISAVDSPNIGSFKNLFFVEDLKSVDRLLPDVSLENKVDGCTCPAFVWHTADDASVPVQNSLNYCNALARHGIPFELHVFPHGPHGLSLADEATCGENADPYVARWHEFSVKWLKKLWN